VINLPTHTFPTDDGDVDLKCPTEIAISDRREAELSKSGLLPLIHRKNTDKAAFIGAQSLYRPKKYDNVDATASDNISSRIPYMFAVSRFSHYLKCMVRDQIGEFDKTPQLDPFVAAYAGIGRGPAGVATDEIIDHGLPEQPALIDDLIRDLQALGHIPGDADLTAASLLPLF